MPPGEDANAIPRFVVGVDGSEPSRAALRWAIRQASVTGSLVEAVIAWHFPYRTTPIGCAPATQLAGAEFAGSARKVLAGAVTAIADPAWAVPVEMTVTEGSPMEMS